MTRLYLTGNILIKVNKNTGLKQREDVRTEQAVGLTMYIQVRGEKAPQEQCQCQD